MSASLLCDGAQHISKLVDGKYIHSLIKATFDDEISLRFSRARVSNFVIYVLKYSSNKENNLQLVYIITIHLFLL